MNKTKKISLDTKSIDSLIKSLNSLNKSIEKLPNVISKEIAKQGISRLDELYMSRHEDPNITDIKTSVERSISGYKIVSQGKDVIYEEFGTGDKGKKSPHVEKSKYNLKPYNSGKYIRDVNPNNEKLASKGITSGKYWTYKKDGQVYYTQGVPAGMEMFKTVKHLKDKVIKEVLDEKAGDVLSKV